jgi:hypothetical protein
VLSVTGNVFITHPPQETPYREHYFFQFIAVSKHPTKDKRTPHRINVWVPADALEKAREILQPGEMIFVRHGNLDSKAMETGAVVSTVRTTWSDIEHMLRVPGRERHV